MGFFDLFTDLLYKARGVHINRVGLEDFAPRFTAVLKAMLAEVKIWELAGIDWKGEWSESREQESIDAYVAHLSARFQPAHNALNDVKLDKPYAKLHRLAMIASRAYGEALTSQIEEKRLFLSPQYLSKAYHQKQRDTRQWNDLTWEYIENLVDEARRIEVDDPQAFRLLAPSDVILENIEAPQPGKSPWEP